MVYNDIQKLSNSKKNINELCENIKKKIELLDQLFNDMGQVWKDDKYKENYENFQKIYNELNITKEKVKNLPDYMEVVINKATEYLDLQFYDSGIAISEFDFNNEDEFYVEPKENESSSMNGTSQNNNIVEDFNRISFNWKDCLKNKIFEENVVETLSHNDYIIKNSYKEIVTFLNGLKNCMDEL